LSSSSPRHASARNAARSFGSRSRAEWYSSSIWRKRSGVIASPERFFCTTIPLLSLARNYRPAATSTASTAFPKLRATVNQHQLVIGELDRLPVHLQVVRAVPLCLHYSALGVPHQALQNVRDLVGDHVT